MPRYNIGTISKCLLCKVRHDDDVEKYGHEKVTNSKTKVLCSICNVYIQTEYIPIHRTSQRHRFRKSHGFVKKIAARKPAVRKVAVKKVKRRKHEIEYDDEGMIVLRFQ